MASSSVKIENCESSTEENKTLNSENRVKLPDLKVQDLKVQLEKRSLDKTGVKSVLFERLKNALIEEGEDPEIFTFHTVGESSNKQIAIKKNKLSNTEVNGEVHIKEDMNDGIELDIKDEVLDVIGDEFIEMNIDNDDKCSNEVTLQLSIDEEDAQLNDEENILDISKIIDSESEIKSDIEKPIDIVSCDISVTEKASPVKNTPTKAAKPLIEEVKKKKKASPVTKSSDSRIAVLSKASKVLGKSSNTKNVSTLNKCLCITGLPCTTRAADLKVLFSKQGKVLSVKIVKSAKQTPGKWYGFVTMATSKDATKAIQNLHRVELNGHVISVEKAQSDPSVLVKKLESKLVSPSSKLASGAKKPAKKDSSSSKSVDTSKSSSSSEHKVGKQESKTSVKKSVESTDKIKDKKINDKSKGRDTDRRTRESKSKEYKSREVEDRLKRRPQFRRPPPFRQRPFSFSERPGFGASRRAFAPRPYSVRGGFSSDRLSRSSSTAYSLQKIREERLRLRAEREIEKRRLEEITRHRFIERKQREEAYRLEREKEKLRLEREMLEREKAEILKLEREKQRLERERLERERDELRRQSELRRSSKRPIARVHERETEQFWKKPAPRYEARASFTAEPSTNSRYDYPTKERAPVVPKHEYERRAERFNPKTVEPASRVGYDSRDSRREVTIRSRDERQVYDRSIYRADRDSRPSFPDRERHSTTKRDSSRIDWKHDRRVHERVIPSTSNSSSRRMYY
ncbi:SAFB-like transcription modulator [Parasteatoda tepidariorum]|uniref:SAFB-like transcription modulator n=1 Tax=Parasteatoda tepidariorum TaxID=114398 RepID=UPI001C71F329|nr:scaffold attachment factor B2 [Parasteatoda tepidariorum]